jgi:hypothetical protein
MANNKLLMINLFDMVQEQLFLGDRLRSGEFATFMNPGQFISTKLQESSADDMFIQSDLVNDVLDTSFIYKPLVGTVNSTCGEALEFASLPTKTTTSREDDELEDIRDWQQDHAPDYELYMNRYYDALEAHEQYRATENPNQARLARLKDRARLAYAKWNGDGYRQDWIDKERRLTQILSGNPTTWWGDLREKFNSQKNTSPHYNAEYLTTLLSPKVTEWSDVNTSWGKFSKTINESSSQEHSRSTSWGGGFSAGWGMWSVGAGGGGSSHYEHSEPDVSEVLVEFEYLRVRIIRPWLNTNMFNYKFWTWNKEHGFQYVSDGGNLMLDPPVRPMGLMPFLPTHAIVARNIKLSSTYTHRDETLITSQMSAGASFGWGPFSISGHYEESNRDHYTNASYDSGVLTITHPQIIAFTGILLPKSPDPLLNLPWDLNDAAFPSMQMSTQLEEFEAARIEDEARWQTDALYRKALAELGAKFAQEQSQLMAQYDDVFSKTKEELSGNKRSKRQ